MKKILKLPTIIGVLVLVMGMIAGIYLINSRQVFKLSANVEAIPKNVRFSNISDNAITVTWSTEIESLGFVKWGNSEGSLSKVALEEGANKSFVHSANIVGATAGSSVFIKINSDSKDYDNNGAVWQTKALSNKITPGNSLIASGTILQSDGSSPAKALVYLTINGLVLSNLTSDEGNFIIPVSTYINSISETTAIEITVNAGAAGTSQAVIYPKAIKAIPTIVLGKTYDFRSITVNNSNDSPQSLLSVPESVEISSRFEIEKVESTSGVATVSVDSIKEGEIITTTGPEFFGKGPTDTSIEVSVQSELQTATTTVDSKGQWSWSPPKNLEPGEHKVVVKWRDAAGILRTITRSFIVQASEGPAFESTPSATPLVKATSTPVSTTSATPKVSSTPLATIPSSMDTGDPIATIGLFMMGIGILLSSIYVWNKSYTD